MKDILDDIMIPGLEKIRDRFLSMLKDRKCEIAVYALNAWDGDNAEMINENLGHARDILHKIAGSAGSLGFVALGDAARSCETEIIAHLEGEYADLAICPPAVMHQIDHFVAQCEQLIAEHD